MENSEKNEFDPSQAGGPALAYLGDAVIELMVRTKLVKKGVRDTGKLNAMARGYVTAGAQSAAVDLVMPHLTEEEAAVFRRGRNSHTSSVPHSASAVDYRRATGLEALFGWLCLRGETGRLSELFGICYPEKDFEETESDE